MSKYFVCKLSCLLCIAVVAALQLGCSSASTGGDTRPEGASPPPVSAKPQASADLVQGYAIKGVISGAAVTVFPIENGVVNMDNPIGSAVTNEEGLFSLAIDDIHLGKPVLFRLESLAQGSTLKCDLIAGCGTGVRFGGTLNVTVGDLEMTLMAAKLQKGRYYNFSTFSTIASELIEQNLTPALSENEISEDIAKTNARVANRFGILGDLTAIDILDLTNPIIDESYQAYKSTVLNIGVVAAQRQKQPGLSLHQSFNAVVDTVVTSGLADRAQNTSSVDYVSVLEQASNVVRYLGLNAHPKASFLLSDLSSLKGIASTSPMDDFYIGEESETLLADAQNQGKNIVKEIRQIGGSLDLVSLGKLTEFSLDTLIDIESSALYKQFLGRSTAAKLMGNDQTSYAIDAFLESIEAMLFVIADEADNGARPIGTYEIVSDNDVSLTYTRLNNQVRIFSILDRINVCDGAANPMSPNCLVDTDLEFRLDAIIGVSKFFNPERVGLDLDLNSFDISGQFTAGQNRITVKPGTQILSDVLTFEYGDNAAMGAPGIELTDTTLYMFARLFSARILVEYSDITAASIESMAQTFDISADELAVDYLNETRSNTLDLTTVSTTTWLIERARALNATIVGEVTDDMLQNSVYAINVVSDAMGDVYSFKTKTRKICAVPNDESQCLTEDLELAEDELGDFAESGDRFLNAAYQFTFDADFAGIIDPVKATLAGERKSENENTLVVGVRYPGHHLTMEGDVDIKGQIQHLDAINQDGSRVYIAKPDGKNRSGTVVAASGGVVAPVIDMGEWIKIPFADGFFQSL